MSHDLFEDPDFYDFSSSELLSWIYLLCQASRKNSETIRVNLAHVERIGRIKPKEFNAAIERMLTLGMVSFDGAGEDAPDRFKRVEARNKVKTAVRNGTLTRPAVCQECAQPSNRIDAHHTDYDKPLDVQWLCPTCHGRKHTKTPAYEYDTYTNATNGRDERDERDERTEVSVAVEATAPAAPIAPQLVGDYSLTAKELLAEVPAAIQESWIASYPDPAWIKQEINKAAAWILANPKRAPKKFPRFMGDWLARGWERFRKTLPSNPAQGPEPEWVKQAKAEEAARRKNAV